MTTEEIIKSFYDGLAQKNESWQEHLSENIVFSDASKKLHAEGKQEFITSFNSFLRAVENVQVKQMIIQGTDACSIVSYDYVSPKGSKMHQDDAEVWKIEYGKIVSLTIYFDITEFRNFMVK